MSSRISVITSASCLPHIVCDLDYSDVSAGDDNEDDNLCGDREILRAINMGTGLRLCPPAPKTGGLWTQVPFNCCATCPLLQCSSPRCHRCHPQSCLPLVVWLQREQGGVWGGQRGSWRRTRLTMTRAENNKMGEGRSRINNNQPLMGSVQ